MKRVTAVAILSCLLTIFIFTTTSADWNKISLVDNHSFQNWLPDRSMRWHPNYEQFMLFYGGDRLYFATDYLGKWDVGIYDETIGRGSATSTFIDSNGNIHISYYDEKTKDLYYGLIYNNWRIHLVRDYGDVGYYNSIIVDPTGNVYIAYSYESSSGENYIYVAERKHETWIWNDYLVDTAEGCGFFPSIAIAGDGYPSVSYYCELGGGNTALKYSHFSGTDFTQQTVDTDGGLGSSLVFNDSGTPHIAYYKDGDPYHAWWNGVSWDTEVVDDSANDIGSHNQLEFVDGVLSLLTVDSTNYKLMLYKKDPIWTSEELATGTSGTMVFAGAWNDDHDLCVALKETHSDKAELSLICGNSNTGWTTEKLDEYHEAGDARELAVDSKGWPHAVYAKNEGYYIGWNDNQWERTTVLSGAADPYYFSGIDLMANDTPTVLFASKTNELIRGWATESGWQTGTITTPTDAAFASKIRVDPNGRLHALYLDSGYDLYYTSYDDFNGWEHQLLSSGFIVDTIFDLEVDSTSNAHIVFRNESDNLMTYRIIDPAGGWSSVNFASSGTIGESCNLALDNNESPIILYTEAGSDGLYLKYDDGSKGWVDNILDTGTAQNALNGLDVDSEGGIHLSYFAYEDGELRYGYLENPEDDTMETVTIDFFGIDLPGNSTLVLDPEQIPMVLYDDPLYKKHNLAFPMPEPHITLIYPDRGTVGEVIARVRIEGNWLFGVTEACLNSFFIYEDCTDDGYTFYCEELTNSSREELTCKFDFSSGWHEDYLDLKIIAANGTVVIEDAFFISEYYNDDWSDDDWDDDDWDDDDWDDEGLNFANQQKKGEEEKEKDFCGCEE